MGTVRNLREVELTKIGDLIALTGLTPRALRYYEDKGLVQPRRGVHNVRYYDEAARNRVWTIVQLRKAGLALKVIQRILDAQDGKQAVAETTRRLIKERIEALEAELSTLMSLADELGQDADEPRRAERL